MIEKELAKYRELVCGHYTSVEMIELFKVFQENKDVFFCMNCGEWIERKPKENLAKELPVECPF